MKQERLPRLSEPKKRKNRSGKIIFLLVLFFLILLAVLFFRSDLSKVEQIEIAGTRYTTLAQVEQALAVKEGDSFFSATAGALKERILKLPYVSEAVVTKSFPGDVTVEIREFEEVAYSLDSDGRIVAMLENGLTVAPHADEPIRYLPILSGWEQGSEPLQEMAALLASIPGPVLADISQIKPDPSRSYPGRIRIYTRSYFEVITTVEYLPDKLDYMRAIIAEYEPGIITMLEANSYHPYAPEEDGADAEETDHSGVIESAEDRETSA